jgi:hypothetical protein
MAEEKEYNEENFSDEEDIHINIHEPVENEVIDNRRLFIDLFSSMLVIGSLQRRVEHLNYPGNRRQFLPEVPNIRSITYSDYLRELEEEEMRIAIRESEEMYRYLEKKNVKIDGKNVVKYEDVKTELTECVICKEDFEKEDSVIMLKCSHVFHESCLEEAIKYLARCPMCRDDVDCEEIKKQYNK